MGTETNSSQSTTSSGFRRTGNEIPLGPPRFTGDWKNDSRQMANWCADFIKVTISETGLLDPQYQQRVGEISFDKLPDPQATTIARAQATANKAWEEGEQFKVDLEGHLDKWIFGGSFQITSGTDQGNPVFPLDLETTDYHAVVTPTGATGGSPSADAFRIIQITKGSGGMAVFVGGAPGGGATVSYDYIVIAPRPNLTELNDEEE
jgi:hypothetical protein